MMELIDGVAYECTVQEADQYEYWYHSPSTTSYGDRKRELVASNNLRKLKSAAKASGKRIVFIQRKTGCFSYGQHLSDEYPYRPRR